MSQYSIHQVDSGAGYLQMDCSARLGCFLDFVQFPKSTKNKRDSFFVIISDKCITKVCEIILETRNIRNAENVSAYHLQDIVLTRNY